MDNVNIYGDIIYSYGTRKAIEDNQLVDYKLIAPFMQSNKFKEYIDKNAIAKLKTQEIESEILMIAIMILNCFVNEDLNFQHLLVFSNTNNKSQDIFKTIEYLLDESYLELKNKIYLKNLSGNDNMNKRKYCINEFEKAEKGIICSAKILGEGIDIKKCDGVVFVDSKQSTIEIIQYACRCLRICQDKTNKKGHIFIPFMINTDDFEEFFSIESKNYNKIRRVLKALGTTDENVKDKFSVINGMIKNKKNKDSDTDDVFDITNEINLKEFKQ